VAVLDESEGEGGTPESAEGVGAARRRTDRPAGLGRACLRGRPLPQEEAEPAMRAGGERETAGGGQVGRAVLRQRGDDGGGAAAGERLLHRPQHVERARHPHEDEARHRQPERVEPRTVGPARLGGGETGLDPHHLAAMGGLRPACQPQQESGRGAEVEGTGGRDLVQGAKRQPAAEHGVDSFDMERNLPRYFRRKGTPLQPGNLLAQLLQGIRSGGGVHSLRS
jgi:hypothetical protein